MTLSNKLIKIAEQIRNIDSNSVMSVLLQASKEDNAVSFDYISIETGKLKKYIVLPLQVKLRKLKKSSDTMLYAQDVENNNKTKSFVLKNIRNIKIEGNKYKRIRENLLTKMNN